MNEQRLGLVVEGSLVEGLRARLDAAASVEDMRVGHFVRIAGERHDFFCLVTDVQLNATSGDVLADPPAPDDGFLRAVLAGTAAYGALKIQPMLMLARDAGAGSWGLGDGKAHPQLPAPSSQLPVEGPLPVRTVPTHFSPVYSAAAGDFERVFGKADDVHFEIGRPRDMDVPVCLDLRHFVERSNGVFGKSGTGKSFLTRLLLCGVIRSGVAVNLVFDMHGEYGWAGRSEGGSTVKGLQQLFGSKVAVYTLDWESARHRQVRPDGQIAIGLNEIEVEDIALLQDELRLNPTAVESANLCEDRLGKQDWIERLTAEDVDVTELAQRIGANAASLGALRTKLRAHLLRLKFIRPRVSERDSGLDALIAALQAGRHVVLEFGQHRSLLAYMLAANVITRLIHRRWTAAVEAHQQGRGGPAPRQLVITIEEAHKFLNPRAAGQTTFGTIARELRKFNVTLLVVDQRPSGIDAEVLSQIGTRITCQLNDERDIDAIFTGVSGAGHLRAVLATLDSRQEALILGHAVPMPLPLRTRPYDEAFYRSLGPRGEDPLAAVAAASRHYEELFPDDD